MADKDFDMVGDCVSNAAPCALLIHKVWHACVLTLLHENMYEVRKFSFYQVLRPLSRLGKNDKIMYGMTD